MKVEGPIKKYIKFVNEMNFKDFSEKLPIEMTSGLNRYKIFRVEGTEVTRKHKGQITAVRKRQNTNELR